MGENGQLLLHRIKSHHFVIMQRRTEESLVADHFNGEAHTLADMTVVAIGQLYSYHSCLPKISESRWIRTLGTSHPLTSGWIEIYSITICGALGILQARLTSSLLAIPGSSNYVQTFSINIMCITSIMYRAHRS